MDDKVRQQYAGALFAKYNFKFEPTTWHDQVPAHAQRVEKKPRMRVRHICHQCKNTFGRDKVCSACQHQRCGECTRYPVKRTAEQSAARKRSKAELPQPVTTLPTTGACHECKTDFSIGEAECGNCSHKICERCLRETVMSTASFPPSTISQPSTTPVVA